MEIKENMLLICEDLKNEISKSVKDFPDNINFSDVTLVSEDGAHVQVNQTLLAMSSEFFKTLLTNTIQRSNLIFLTQFDVKYLKYLKEFIYQGQINILKLEITDFLKIASELEIKGIDKQKLHFTLLPGPGDQQEENGKELEEKIENEIENNIYQTFFDNKSLEAETKDNVPEEIQTTEIQIEENVDNKTNRIFEVYFETAAPAETPRKTIVCNYCNDIFSKKRNLDRHVNILHIEVKTCTVCSKVFKNKNIYRQHVKDHAKTYQCDECLVQVTRKVQLKIHKRSKHDPTKLKLVDGPVKSTNDSLNTKIGNAIQEEKYGNIEIARSLYKSLLLAYDGRDLGTGKIKRYMAEFEERNGNYKESLKILKGFVNKIKTHQVKCDVCDKEFKSEFSLKRHMHRYHSSDVRCRKCQMELKGKVALDKHEIDCIWKCEKVNCYYTTIHKYELHKHLFKIHGKNTSE